MLLAAVGAAPSTELRKLGDTTPAEQPEELPLPLTDSLHCVTAAWRAATAATAEAQVRCYRYRRHRGVRGAAALGYKFTVYLADPATRPK